MIVFQQVFPLGGGGGFKVIRLITDNASNNFRPDNDDNIQYDFDKQEELLRLPCFTHTLQLVVKEGLDENECIRSPLGKVAEIAKLSHKSIVVAENCKMKILVSQKLL